jgi:glycosyltransferase involved in cell wall biosynthesis
MLALFHFAARMRSLQIHLHLMRIGIDARIFGSQYTGIGRYVQELVEQMADLASQHEFVLFMNEPQFHEYEAPKNVKKVLVNAHHYSLKEQWSFFWKLRKAKLDLMHFTHFNAPILYKNPSVVTIHDLTLSFYPGKKMNSWLHRKAYHLTLSHAVKHAKKVIAVSENTKLDLIKVLGTPDEKITVIYEGVGENFTPREDKEGLAELIKKYGITKDYLLYTGVWRSHKNLINLIRAFAILKQDESFDLQLVITGKEDPYYPEVRRTVKELGLEYSVIFPGMVPEDELTALYQGVFTYVFPSLYEGFGLPPLEAMRCGTPVVASKASCIPEICGENNALFFDPYDPEDMANSIRRVWLDGDLRKDLRERGLRHSRKFSWKSMAEETLALYEKP